MFVLRLTLAFALRLTLDVLPGPLWAALRLTVLPPP
jgi:hypothetical protein